MAPESNSHRAFARLISLAVVGAFLAGASASPPRDVPTYALDSALIYKCEVALASFLTAYLFVAAILLAMQGRTVRKISTTGFDLPQELSTSVTTQQALLETQEQTQLGLAKQDERLSGEINSLWEAVRRLGGRCPH